MNATGVHASEAVPNVEGSVCRHRDVVIDRVRRVLAQAEERMLFLVGIIRLDAHAFARLLHFNLNLLCERFGLVA